MNKRILVLAFAVLSFTLALPVWSQTAINSGQTIGALSGSRLSARYYRIHVPAGKSRLVFQTWGGSGNADLFVRYRYGLPSTSISTARSTAAGNNATITINNPAAGSWYILVRGEAAYSGVYLRATYSVIAPAAPTGIAATQNLTQQVRVSWNAVSRATSYEVWRRASTAALGMRIATTTSTSFSDVHAAVGVTYYYWVRARNSAGVSGISARVTGRRTPVPVPSGVAATQTMTQQIRVTWSASSGAASYEVWRRPSTVATATRIATPTSTSFSDVSATAGVTYYYWVRARNSAGVSGFSARVTGRRAPITLLSNGQSFGTFGGSQGSMRYFRLSVPAGQTRLVVQTWGGSGDADLYVRYGALPSTTLFNGRATSVGNNATVTLNSPAAGYWYVVVRGFLAYSGVSVRATYSENMVLIPGGTNAGTDPDFGAYSLTVDSFYMDRYEVTKAMWDEVYTWAATNGYPDLPVGGGKAANHPVHSVSWYDCIKWLNARSQKDGRTPVYYTDAAFTQVYTAGEVLEPHVKISADGYRLPTDVEWHYAARGGVANRRFPWGDGDNIQHARANYTSDSSFIYDTSSTRGYHPTYETGETPYTSPAGSFAANGYGLHDMAGNVWEWCYDWLPTHVGSHRMIRGGSWAYSADDCRVADRNGSRPIIQYSSFGFRAVLPPGQ